MSRNQCMRTVIAYDESDFMGVDNIRQFFTNDLKAILTFCIRNLPNTKRFRLRLAWDVLFDADFWQSIDLPVLWRGFTTIVSKEGTNYEQLVTDVVTEFLDKLMFYFILEKRKTKTDERDFQNYLSNKITHGGMVADLCNADTCTVADHDPEIVAHLLRDELDAILRYFNETVPPK